MDDFSTGAHNDLERATETARQMVTRFGMSKLGPVTFGRPAESRFLDTPFQGGDDRNYSEETARVIDAEVQRLMAEAHERALSILEERHDTLDRIANALLDREALDRAELEALLPPAAEVPESDRHAPEDEGSVFVPWEGE